ncbi:uncharacterized protein IAS62_005079 [Cryptococcus decagattii]|uniref:Uncharacterized protein n=1 Tax=Cryptococcus decagattii TaxID=1859122 RepID=A0ABZ2AZ90_9TREE
MVSAPLPAASRACRSTVVREEMPTNSLHFKKRQVYLNIAIGSNISARVTVEPVPVSSSPNSCHRYAVYQL